MSVALGDPDTTSIERTGWRYPSGPGRDRRLDLLRGYALAAMAINHFGLSQSYLHEASGRSSFLISAAEAFLFISGFTLGFISTGREPDAALARLRHRTWTVYLATVGISLGFGVVALTTHLELWGNLEAGAFDGTWQWIGQLVTMQTTFNGADILITYVIYLAVAIAALRLMTAGRTGMVVAAVGGLYLLSQLGGDESMQLGFASFRALIPNAPLFFGGLVLGFHRERVAELWATFRFRRLVDAGVVALAVAFAWLHATEWSAWPGLGRLVAGDELSEPLGLREFSMPIVPLLVVGLYLRFAWLVVDAVWVPLRRALGWLVLPLGEASLFTFTMHLVAIPLVINSPWWPGDEPGRVAATAWVVVYLAVIWGAVLARRAVLEWLRSGTPRRELARRHGPVAAVAVLLVAVVVAGVSPAGAAGAWGGGGVEDDDELAELWEVEELVGEAIDRYVEGDLDDDAVIDLLPPDVDPGDRTRVRELLADDPWTAEAEILELLEGVD